MGRPDVRSEEFRHDPEEAARWFSQWHIYRSIVDANWMAHREIFDAVRRWVMLRYPGPFTLLDLGCGDAGFIKGVFDGTALWAYTGIDASPTAVAKAREELAGARFHVQLREADMLAYLREETAPLGRDRKRDVILASYAVHHLPVREKWEFFRLAHEHLPPRGSLLVADIFRRDGEPRAAYLECYVDMMRRHWHGMSPEGLASTIEHVTQRDFPEAAGMLHEMALAAGFGREPQELFRDATGFHRLMAFTRDAAA